MRLHFPEQAFFSPCVWVAQAALQACPHSCTSMFANRPDKATAVRQTQNTNINKQTNPFTHSTPSKHCMHTQPNFKALIQPAVRAHCLPGAALFGSYSYIFLQSCLIINEWCQRVAGLSVWQGISINTDFLSISVCTTLLTFNYGCLNVCYLSTQVCKSVRVCMQAAVNVKAFYLLLVTGLMLCIFGI